MNAEWRWDFAIEILPQMLLATLNTILAAGIGYAIATTPAVKASRVKPKKGST